MWNLNPEQRETVRDWHQPEEQERHPKRTVESLAIGRIDRLHDSSVDEQCGEGPQPKDPECDDASERRTPRERVQIGRVEKRAREQAVDDPQPDDSGTLGPPVDTRLERSEDAAESPHNWESNAASVATMSPTHVSEAGPDNQEADDQPDRCAYGSAEYQNDRRSVEHERACKSEEPAQRGITNCSTTVEQEVLAEFPERNPRPLGAASCTSSELFRVHRHQGTTHPETVCPTEETDQEERREFDLLGRY